MTKEIEKINNIRRPKLFRKNQTSLTDQSSTDSDSNKGRKRSKRQLQKSDASCDDGEIQSTSNQVVGSNPEPGLSMPVKSKERLPEKTNEYDSEVPSDVFTDSERVTTTDSEIEDKDSTICRFCNKTFNYSYNRKRHERNVHIRRGEVLPKDQKQKVEKSQGSEDVLKDSRLQNPSTNDEESPNVSFILLINTSNHNLFLR